MGFEKCNLSGTNRNKYMEYSADFGTGVLPQPRLLEYNATAGVEKQPTKQKTLVTQKLSDCKDGTRLNKCCRYFTFGRP